jgi:hypothetical protein
MSNLNLGIIQDILFVLAIASILHFLREFAITDEDRFKPKMLFTNSEDRIIFLGLSKGVLLFAPEIVTEKS